MIEEFDDADLVRAAGAGDDRAFELIFLRHRDRVRGICFKRLGHAQDVEDAVQDTFLNAFKALPRMRSDDHHLGAWLSQIAIHVCLDRHRRAIRRPRWVPLDGIAPPSDLAPGPEELLTGGDPEIARAMKMMSHLHRSAVELRFLSGLSHIEMGILLGKSPSQVKALVHRAKESLRLVWAAA